MGYEIKLIVGKSGHSSREHKVQDQAVLDDNIAWFPSVKDENDQFIETGRTEIYFSTYGIINLSCPGSQAHLLKLDWKNKEADSVVWYFYEDGNTTVKEDGYGDSPKPVPVAAVIAALEKDFEESKEDYPDSADEQGGGYRRFRWALGFLKAMDDDAEVLLHGH